MTETNQHSPAMMRSSNRGASNNNSNHSNNAVLRVVLLGVLVVGIVGSYMATTEVFRQLDRTGMQYKVMTSVQIPPLVIEATATTIRSEQPDVLPTNTNNNYTVISNVMAVSKTNPKERTESELRQAWARGVLRRHDWTRPVTSLSRFASEIARHQANCDLPVATMELDNSFGIGSHLALWSQGICNAMQAQQRMRTHTDPTWLWLDQTLCDTQQAQDQSPLLCYFPLSEFLCPDPTPLPNVNVTDPRDKKKNQCNLLKQATDPNVLHEFRAASTEYLFRHVSPLVVQEAERQAGLLFGEGASAPDDLITVHIRWGDKFWEMDLAPLDEYIAAVNQLLAEDGRGNETAHIYVATEDPKAVEEFQKATPAGWTIYYDRTVEELRDFRPPKGNRASHMSRNTKGRAGLMGMGSLLLAMEAKRFVLTTKSNWSRIMDHLRTNIINPECGNCTKMIDLRPGVW